MVADESRIQTKLTLEKVLQAIQEDCSKKVCQPLTAVLRQAGFRVPKTDLWLMEVELLKSSFVKKSPALRVAAKTLGAMLQATLRTPTI